MSNGPRRTQVGKNEQTKDLIKKIVDFKPAGVVDNQGSVRRSAA